MCTLVKFETYGNFFLTTALSTSSLQSSRFSAMGDSIMGQMDQMGSRMNELESSINQLMLQAGLAPTESLPPSTLDSSGKKPNTVSI